jgi:hypothetical protein
MKRRTFITAISVGLMPMLFAVSMHMRAEDSNLAALFKSPPMEYRPVPLRFINGKLTQSDTIRQIEDAYKVGFGGVSPLPTTARSGGGPGGSLGGTPPGSGTLPGRGTAPVGETPPAGGAGQVGGRGTNNFPGVEPECFSDAFLAEYSYTPARTSAAYREPAWCLGFPSFRR